MKVYYLNKGKKPDTRYANRYSQFRMFEVHQGFQMDSLRSSETRLFFVLKGKIAVKWQRDEMPEQTICSEEIIFVPQNIDGELKVLESSSFIVLSYSMPHPLAHKITIEYLFANNSYKNFKVNENIYSLSFTSNITLFLKLLEAYIKRKETAQEKDILQYIHQAKEEELYSLFQMEYDARDLASFFAPGLSENINFHALVMANYKSCRTIKDLARKCGYDRIKFNTLFKEYFHDTPYNWLNQQTKLMVENELMNKDLKIKDIMNKYNFSSFSHFTSFCYRNFGKAPSALRKKSKKLVPNEVS